MMVMITIMTATIATSIRITIIVLVLQLVLQILLIDKTPYVTYKLNSKSKTWINILSPHHIDIVGNYRDGNE